MLTEIHYSVTTDYVVRLEYSELAELAATEQIMIPTREELRAAQHPLALTVEATGELSDVLEADSTEEDSGPVQITCIAAISE